MSAITTALSGFTAATQRLNVSANNIANAFSASYTTQETTQSSQAGGGVTTTIQNTAATNQDASSPAQYPNADIAQQLIQTQIASYDAKGSLSVIKAQNATFKSLLNIVS